MCFWHWLCCRKKNCIARPESAGRQQASDRGEHTRSLETRVRVKSVHEDSGNGQTLINKCEETKQKETNKRGWVYQRRRDQHISVDSASGQQPPQGSAVTFSFIANDFISLQLLLWLFLIKGWLLVSNDAKASKNVVPAFGRVQWKSSLMVLNPLF